MTKDNIFKFKEYREPDRTEYILISRSILGFKYEIIDHFFYERELPDFITHYKAIDTRVYDLVQRDRSNLYGEEDEYYKYVLLNLTKKHEER